jgi:hypothetical protein
MYTTMVVVNDLMYHCISMSGNLLTITYQHSMETSYHLCDNEIIIITTLNQHILSVNRNCYIKGDTTHEFINKRRRSAIKYQQTCGNLKSANILNLYKWF